MKHGRSIAWIAAAAIAALAPRGTTLNAAGNGDPPQLTDIEEVVMYAIDADTYELLRYTFDTDEYVRIGVVTDQDGNVVTDVEGLAMIPHGPHKGLYGTANFYLTRPSSLVKINALDATAWVYPTGLGSEKVEGLVAVQDQVTYEWSLLGAHKLPDTGLIEIDPLTGIGTPVMPTVGRYHGLARAPDGTLYGSTKNPAELWAIDLDTGDEDFIGRMDGYTKCEALEHAFGDSQPRIKVPSGGGSPVVPDAWTQDGILFGFDDVADALLIINRASGAAVEWACAFRTIDCEGLVFTTQQRDPYGPIVACAGD